VGDTANRVPIPQGYATPTELTHILRTRKIVDIKAQYIYGYISTPGNDFPWQFHEDGRKIVPVDDAIKWIVGYLQAKAEKESRKAMQAVEKAQSAAVSANLATVSTIPIETDATSDGRMYLGGIGRLLIEYTDISVSYQSRITTRLRRMGCTTMYKRGGGLAPSVWLLHKEPTIELFKQSDLSGDIRYIQDKERTDALEQRYNDLARRLAKLEEWAMDQGAPV
jgi:hypothetical protein